VKGYQSAVDLFEKRIRFIRQAYEINDSLITMRHQCEAHFSASVTHFTPPTQRKGGSNFVPLRFDSALAKEILCNAAESAVVSLAGGVRDQMYIDSVLRASSVLVDLSAMEDSTRKTAIVDSITRVN
jgi:hypothetical protein